MAMKISNAGLDIIKRYEGCELEAYKCPAGVWTIGYGHTKGVKPGMKITVAKAEAYLKADCKSSEKAVNKYMKKYNFNQNQFDALVSFTFNCGAGNLKSLLDNGKRDIETISKKIPAYCKANGHTLAGLLKRRNSEKALFDKKIIFTIRNIKDLLFKLMWYSKLSVYLQNIMVTLLEERKLLLRMVLKDI